MDISRGKGGDNVLGSLRIQLAREEGQALIEYALIVSLIAVIAIVALQVTGHSIAGILNTISQAV
jgi:Flp pilus assembly pilin Flp